jgi:hypothetical protein
VKILLGQVRKPLVQTVQKEVVGELRQLEGLHEPGLGRHASERRDVQPVIGARFDVHTLILPDFSGKINLRKYSLANKWFFTLPLAT